MTAVEWLYERLERMIPRNALYNIDKMQYFEQAKEMEKQQGYSEEEVLEIIRQYALEEHLITSSKPDIWFKQFKKK